MPKPQTSPHRNGLIVLNTAAFGGISDYLHFQANALVEQGISVTMVGSIDGPRKRDARYEFVPLWHQPKKSKVRLIQQAGFVANLLSNMRRFAAFLKTRPERFVLFGGFLEYIAPFWAGLFRKLRRRGWTFATVIHDPVRDYVVGPEWWHRRSIRAGYSFVCTGFMHGRTEEVTDATGVKLVKVPFGQFPFPPASKNRNQIRKDLRIPVDATVVLAFGHLRDGKNLDLLIKAIADLPNVHLIIAGKEQSGGQRPASFYQSLSIDLGVANRCHFHVRYINDTEIGNFFAATDINALTYSKAFRSASGALASATHYRKPSIASSGEGPLKQVIEEYNLGIWVEPDSADAIRDGLNNLQTLNFAPEWERYQSENSWSQNAIIIAKAMGLTK
ncbi:MAG: glycosyltransferase family 4 protein [Fuerstiella sp.]